MKNRSVDGTDDVVFCSLVVVVASSVALLRPRWATGVRSCRHWRRRCPVSSPTLPSLPARSPASRSPREHPRRQRPLRVASSGTLAPNPRRNGRRPRDAAPQGAAPPRRRGPAGRRRRRARPARPLRLTPEGRRDLLHRRALVQLAVVLVPLGHVGARQQAERLIGRLGHGRPAGPWRARASEN